MFNRSTSIEIILDRCITEIREHQRTVDECLSLYPEQRTELEPLLRLSLRLNAANTLQAPPDFQRTALIRMNNLISAHPRDGGQADGKPARREPLRMPDFPASLFRKFDTVPERRQLSFFSLVSIALVFLIILGWSIMDVSARALPGQPLYPIKSSIESLRLALTNSEAGDASLRQDFAQRRLDEATIMVQERRTEAITRTLTDYNNELRSTLGYLEMESQLPQENRARIAKRLTVDLPANEVALKNLLSHTPAEIHEVIQEALMITRRGYALATMILGRLPGPPEELPGRSKDMPNPAQASTIRADKTAGPSQARPAVEETPRPQNQPPGQGDYKPPARPSKDVPAIEKSAKPKNQPPGWTTHMPTTRPGAWPTAWAPGLSNPKRPPHMTKTPGHPRLKP